LAISAKRTRTIVARRQDLIDGTIRSIAEHGYANSTVQTICESVGLSRGLIGHYFHGKDDLLLEAFRHMCARSDERMRHAIDAVGEDPLQRLLAATRVTFESASSRDNALVWLACCGVAPWNASMTALHNRLYRRYRAWIERMIAEAAAERGIVLDAKRAALTYAQMVDGFWIGWLMDKDAFSLDEATQIVSDWVLDLLGERAIAVKAAKRPPVRASSKRKSGESRKPTARRGTLKKPVRA
jgi:TetR/AcrR family transcriptional repressor of bet genes